MCTIIKERSERRGFDLTKLEIAAVKLQTKLNSAFPNSYKKLFSSAVITAAGSGTRMGGTKKQLMPLLDRPCILYSLLAFQNCTDISEIIVVSREEDIPEIKKICLEHKITKLSSIVSGGKTRQESVSRGFSVINPKADFVAIHDAARPLVLPSHISRLLENAKKYGAATAAKKISDTIKKANSRQIILETVPREDLYSVQTPQVFKTDLYRVSLALAHKSGVEVTDDCALAEFAGFQVKLCEIGAPNLKITTPEDLDLINFYLKERENG